jgi:DNA-binding transcriptional regulator GbsR (MarR family)
MTGRDEDRKLMLDYVEQFTELLASSGLQRMSARVFAYILIDDDDTYTAAEIAEGLGISLAAVSGAVRELTVAGMLIKGRRPSTRADVYRLQDEDIWGAIMLNRNPILERYRRFTLDALERLPDGPGRDRLVQTAAFMEFMQVEMDKLRTRWDERRRELAAQIEARRHQRESSR